MKNIYDIISETIKSGKTAALCTITKTQGSTPRKAGSKMLVFTNSQIAGTIGGGALEGQAIKNALKIISSGKSELFTHALEKDHQMGCGGYVEIFIEPLNSQKKLYVFGGGHVGKKLAEFSYNLNFNVTVIDSRPEIFASYTNENIHTLNKSITEAFEILEFNENVFICSATHEHSGDRKVLINALEKQFAYLGMIGSSRKVEKSKDVLSKKGFSQEQIDSIDMPMGVPINCETPEEIAISILAKLIDVRTGN